MTRPNDRQFFECAQALGARLQHAAATDDERLQTGFRLCVSRAPTAPELERLRRLLAELRLPAESGQAASESEVWTTVGRVLLTLDETLNRS